MKAVLQRHLGATLRCNETLIEVKGGLLLLLGLERGDSLSKGHSLLEKVARTAVFSDKDGRISLPPPRNTPLLIVPNFTLPARFKGGIPDFGRALVSSDARPLFSSIVDRAHDHGFEAKGGPFGAQVTLQVTLEGPVTYFFDL